MADNIDVDPGTGVGKKAVATDEVSGVQYQVIKIATGGDGVANYLSNSAPLPIADAGGSITVDGTVAISGGTITVSGSTAIPTTSGGFEYETVAASQTDQIMGATGAVGDYLEGLVCVVATAATSQVQIKDGNGSAITVLPNAVGAGVGTYYVPLGLKCIAATTPGWKITTAAGVGVLATGDFT